jgi:hypothetical protein
MHLLLSAVVYALLIVGFIVAAWITNSIFSFFKKQEESGPFDSIVALALMCGLFGSYSYLISGLLP